ncbi:MAG: hypothetical protein LC749_01085, partial [Actinobacteria bacterium]|nr:hypothetical protein [Actinomycetota bacterium]
MFLVNLPKSWPAVLAGTANAARVTLGEWARVTDADLETYGDAVLGVYRNVVVSAYDITGWSRTPDGRVVFDGVESEEWARLRGQPVPGTPWVRGAARPVKT